MIGTYGYIVDTMPDRLPTSRGPQRFTTGLQRGGYSGHGGDGYGAFKWLSNLFQSKASRQRQTTMDELRGDDWSAMFGGDMIDVGAPPGESYQSQSKPRRDPLTGNMIIDAVDVVGEATTGISNLIWSLKGGKPVPVDPTAYLRDAAAAREAQAAQQQTMMLAILGLTGAGLLVLVVIAATQKGGKKK